MDVFIDHGKTEKHNWTNFEKSEKYKWTNFQNLKT